MRLPLSELPRIVEVLAVSGVPRFVILGYAEYVRFVVRAGLAAEAEVVSVLDVGDTHAFVVLSFPQLRDWLLRLEISGSLDEPAYLARYPDVAAAVGMIF